MKQKIFVEVADNKSVQKIWDACSRISQSMSYPSFFCSSEWLRTAAQNLLPNDNLLIITVKADYLIKAILPLIERRNILGGIDLRFLGADFYPDPLGLICAHSDRSTFIAALKDFLLKHSKWDRLFLDWILEEEAQMWNAPARHRTISPYKILPFSFDELLTEFTSKKRNDLRRKVRKFFDAGGEFLVSENISTNIFFLDNLFKQHKSRSAERNIASSFSGNRVEKFHKMLVTNSPNVRFYGLQVNNKLISIIYGYEYSNIFYYYQVSHDPEFYKLSPGSVLLHLVLEDCCKRGLKEFNFLQGDENYKEGWTKKSRSLYHCVLKMDTIRAHLLDGLDNWKRMVKQIGRKTQFKT